MAWWTAARYPERLAKLVILNVPHGSVMNKHLRSNYAQMRKSWYIFAFQIPWLPEALARARNWRLAANSLKNSSRPGTFAEEELDKYREAWSRKDAYRSMLNWYRAILQHPPQNPPLRIITVPTLLLWGAQDKFFRRELAQESMKYCEEEQLVILEAATHWLQHEEPDRVNELIGSFLQAGGENA